MAAVQFYLPMASSNLRQESGRLKQGDPCT